MQTMISITEMIMVILVTFSVAFVMGILFGRIIEKFKCFYKSDEND